MCGVMCAWGPDSAAIVMNGLAKMQHRGPDGTGSHQIGDVHLGFARLSINDHTETGMQPFSWSNFWGVFNCEIYNHEDLRNKYSLDQVLGSDAAVILPLFSRNSSQILNRIEGFYSGVIYDSNNERLYTLRDSIGQKPLFMARSGNTYILTSELKSCPKLDAFEEVPLGLCQISLKRGEISILTVSQPSKPSPGNNNLADLLYQSVNARTKSRDNAEFGVFLSGGLDSSIIASLVNKTEARGRARYYFIDDVKSEDTAFAKDVLSFLKIPDSQISPVSPPSQLEIKELIDEVVYHTESYNPSIIFNGVGSYILSRAAHMDGLKYVIGGDGADEVFCGYFDFEPDDDWVSNRESLLANLSSTEMRRVDKASMAHSIEVRCPFLDASVRQFADGLSFGDFYDLGEEPPIRKSILRGVFRNMLPASITSRRKLSFDLGSGLQKLIYNFCQDNNQTEMQYLEAVWRKHFQSSLGLLSENPYFWSYPAFDKFMSQRSKKFSSAVSVDSIR